VTYELAGLVGVGGMLKGRFIMADRLSPPTPDATQAPERPPAEPLAAIVGDLTGRIIASVSTLPARAGT
jgi:hypothetical protein